MIREGEDSAAHQASQNHTQSASLPKFEAQKLVRQPVEAGIYVRIMQGIAKVSRAMNSAASMGENLFQKVFVFT